VTRSANAGPLPRFQASIICWYTSRTAVSSLDGCVARWLMAVLLSGQLVSRVRVSAPPVTAMS
jgi:hypothetical protein